MDFLGEVFVFLFQLAWHGAVAAMHSRLGCLLSGVAMLSLMGAVVLLIAAVWQSNPSQQVNLFGLACCSGVAFFVSGVTAAIVKAAEPSSPNQGAK